MLRRRYGQIKDNADSYINPLDHLDSFHFSSDVGLCTSKAMDLQRLRLLQQMYAAHRLIHRIKLWWPRYWLTDREGVDQGPGGIG